VCLRFIVNPAARQPCSNKELISCFGITVVRNIKEGAAKVVEVGGEEADQEGAAGGT